MTRKLKAMGVALVAVFALSAVAASAASADEFHSEGSPTVVTGSQEAANPNIFTAGAAVECTEAQFSGTAANAAQATLEVHPTYGGCKWNSKAATVKTNHCNYILGGTTTAGDAPVTVTCEVSTERIEIILEGICTAKVKPQTVEGGGVHYTSTGAGAGREVTISATASKIKYEKVGGIGCLFAGNGEAGEYTGGVTGKGFVDNGNSGTAYTPNFSEGAQKGIWVE